MVRKSGDMKQPTKTELRQRISFLESEVKRLEEALANAIASSSNTKAEA